MECGEFERILIASSGEDPSAEQAELLESHLFGCAACRSQVDAVASDLRVMAGPLCSEDGRSTAWEPVFQQVMAAVDSPAENIPVSTEPGVQQVERGRGNGRRWLPMAVAAALIVSVGVALLMSGIGSSLEGTSVASGCCEGGVDALSVGQSARLDYLETAPDLVGVAMVPQSEEDVLVIFVQAVANGGG